MRRFFPSNKMKHVPQLADRVRCYPSILFRLATLVLLFNFVLYCHSAIAASKPPLQVIKVGVLKGGWGPFQQWDGNNGSGFSVELIVNSDNKCNAHGA